MREKGHPSLLESFGFASAGLWLVMKSQRNFRIHLSVAVMVVLLAAWVRPSVLGWVALILTIGTVLVAEIFNSAAEKLVDLASPDYHPLAKQVKDMAAGAVLLTAGIAVVVGLLILGPLLWQRLL